MAGAISTISHSGFQSELLAQYVFSSWGAVVATPNPEDHGIDLHCNLVEEVGMRAWARSSYTVQVKSNMEPWVFDGIESVRWLIEHPLPLFLCVVDKPTWRLRLYQTVPRCWAWALGELPNHVTLRPGSGTNGKAARWTGEFDFSLSAPILEFTAGEIAKDDFRSRVSEILKFWIAVDEGNLTRIRSGVGRFSMPQAYKTNEMILSAWETSYRKIATDEQIDQSLPHLKESIEWLGSQLHKRGDVKGAVRAALLLHHIDPKGVFIELWHQLLKLDKHLQGADGKDFKPFAGIDVLGKSLDELIDNALPDDEQNQ